MKSASDTIQVVFGGLVLLAIISAVAVLTWHKSISGEACVSIFSAVLGGGIVGGAQHIGTKTGARAARKVD